MSAPQTPYLVCTTPRTGSSLLCSLLAGTAVAGMRPAPGVGQEYFLKLTGGGAVVDKRDTLDRRRLESYVRDALRRSSTPNGVGGFKVMWLQVVQLAERVADASPGGGFVADHFVTLLPAGTRYVWLRRRDRLRQAVSFAKALQSQCWNSVQQAKFEGRCVFDYIGLRRALRMIALHEAAWGRFFARHEIIPLEIEYEALVEDPAAEVARVLEFLDLDGGGVPVHEPPYRRQSNAVNEEWVARYERVTSRGPMARQLYLWWAAPRWITGRVIQELRLRRRRRRIAAAEPWDGRGARPV